MCPGINGVVVPTYGNSATATIDFRPEATPQQQAAAQSALLAFDWSPAGDAAYADAQEPDLATLRDQAQGAFDAATTAIAAIDAVAVPANLAQAIAEIGRINQRQRAVLTRQRAIIKALARIVSKAL
ncbi:MAG: hypothetical protein ACMG5Z_05940 [Luteimonas sp.]